MPQNWAQLAMSIGMIVAPILSGVIMDYSGIDAVFYFMGGISLFGMALFYQRIKVHKKSNQG